MDKPRKYIFDSHGADSELNSRSGELVKIIRPLTKDEVDIDDVGPMFKVRFSDGFEADVFEDELSKEYLLIEALSELYNFNPRKKIGSEIVFEITDPDDVGTAHEGESLRIGKHWHKVLGQWTYFKCQSNEPCLGCEEKHFVSNIMTTSYAQRVMRYAAQQGTYVIRKVVDTRE